MRLAARHCPDPLGELTALPQTLAGFGGGDDGKARIGRGRDGETGRVGEGKGRGRGGMRPGMG